MALTLRTNGSAGVNLVTAQWWNDYYNLVTGAMSDQTVTFKTDVVLQSILSGSIAAPTLALATGTTLGIGSYSYFVTFVDGNSGETSQANGTVASTTTTSGNQSVALSAIPTGPTGTVSRRIYRTKVGGSSYFLLATISDNTTTTYTDTIADASLPTTTPPANPSFGGSISVKNNSGAVKAQIFSNGAISHDGGAIYSDGAGNLYLDNLYSSNGGLTVMTQQTGAANGITFEVWSGSALKVPFSVGGQFNSAISYVDASGNGFLQQINAQGSGTGNDDLVLLTRTANTTQTIKLGIDNTGAFYAYDANHSGYIFQGLIAGSPLATNRNGTNTPAAVFTGTTTPTSPPPGSIWVKA